MSYQEYDKLDYTPSYGSVDIKSNNSEWSVQVSIEQGRAMEADGIPVMWVHSSVPEWAAHPAIIKIALILDRLFRLPYRLTAKR